jgi:RNA polymerase sigma factor (sigma-70 family)
MASTAMGGTLGQIKRLFGAGSVAGLSDGQLLERFAGSRDESAFAALVERHGPLVLGTCRAVLRDAHDAEDAFQATFLTLARKAGTLRVGAGGTLGGWLYRVATRVAFQARADRRRRRDREVAAPDPIAATNRREGQWDDWLPLLHEEIARLPERQRDPIVLCDLQELTYEQAARQLCWTLPTLRCRLARARGRLRERLSRRGLTATGAVAALAARRGAYATPAVPESWARAAIRAAAEGAASGAVSATAAAWSGRVLRALLAAKLKGAAALVLLVGGAAVAASAFYAYGASRGDDRERGASVPASTASSPPAPQKVEAQAAGEDEGEVVEVGGRVLDPDGRPFAGARIVFHNQKPREKDLPTGPPPARATSDADGRFRFQIGDPGLRLLQARARWSHPTVAALAAGYGPGWATFTSAETARDLTIRLVRDDVPIEGRVLDLEGRPVAGVTVTPWCIFAAPDESLDGWLAAVAKAKDNRDGAMATLHRCLEPAAWAHGRAVVTGVDGRFRLTGIGRERVVSLEFAGPTIVTSGGYVHARTRPGPTYRVPMDRNEPNLGTLVFHGATFDYVAAPSRPIVGMVRDKDTGAPLAGVSIRSDRFAGNIISGRDHARATTDAEGRYRLVGMPGGVGNAITASPWPGQPYLGAGAEVPGGNGTAPAVVDFALKRGILIRGRVTNKATGKPIRAVVEYAVFLDNPHSRDARGLHTQEVPTHDDGTYKLLGLPGHGLVAIRAVEDRYLKGQGADTIPKINQNQFTNTSYRTFAIDQYHAFAEVNTAEDTRDVVCDVPLDPGRSLRGNVLGPDGRPLAGVNVSGLNPTTMSPTDIRLPTADFNAIGLDPAHPRPLFFRHEEKKLAAVAVLRGDEPEPPVVHLQPSASVSGRLLDADGDPRTGFTVNCNIDPKPFGGRFLSAFYLRPTVDDRGRFRVENLVPGVAYDLDAREGNRLTGVIARGLTLQPGESRDLGEIRADREP